MSEEVDPVQNLPTRLSGGADGIGFPSRLFGRGTQHLAVPPTNTAQVYAGCAATDDTRMVSEKDRKGVEDTEKDDEMIFGISMFDGSQHFARPLENTAQEMVDEWLICLTARVPSRVTGNETRGPADS